MDKAVKKARGPATEGFLAQVGKGRPKGVVNKTTKLAKEAIAQVAEGLGGVDRMIAWAKEDEANERVFWSSIYTKLIPVQTEISGKDGEDIKIRQVNDDADVVRRRLTQGLTSIGIGAAPSATVQ